MADNLNEPEAEIEDPDEPNIDFMNKVTGQLLGRWDLQPTRETIKLIANYFETQKSRFMWCSHISHL